MKMNVAVRLTCVVLALALPGCGGSGGGGDSGGDSPDDVVLEIETYATVAADGTAARVDLVDGGTPVSDPTDPADAGNLAPNPAKRSFLNRLMSKSGVDLNGSRLDTNGDGIADAGFETYETGIDVSPSDAARILGANNLYDLFQTTTNNLVLDQNGNRAPVLFQFTTGNPGGPPFTGGNVNAGEDPPLLDGGPGLFTNTETVPGIDSLIPSLPMLPNSMGTPSISGSGQGPGTGDDQHQFVQIVFPYKLDRASLFDYLNDGNSFLGDSTPGASANVIVEKRWITRSAPDDDINVVDHTFEHAHVPGIAIIGGVAAIPFQQGFHELTHVSLTSSNLPEGCKARVMDANVLTYIAHESPAAITQTSDLLIGRILADFTLVLPDPAIGLGGRVFGANTAIPSSVNDFETDPYDPLDANELAAQANRRVGFFSFEITRLRTTQGETLDRPYFHSFPMSQTNVGDDPMAVDGSFNRGPAVEVDAVLRIPAIDVLDPSVDYIGTVVASPSSDAVNTISTRARFLVEFDKEVVPNSVGFSRRHTIHSVVGKGIVFPFNGNTRPVTSPSSLFITGLLGAPVAPSIFLAVNQPTRIAVNNPFLKSNGASKDDGLPILPGSTPAQQAALNGLFPGEHNTLATLPRGVVPCDIYPLNQNNLQAYVVEPLVELPPGRIVTLGVCMGGLGLSNNNLPPGFPASTTNIGNFTRAGTQFTPWQGLTPVGLGDSDVATKQVVVGNGTIIKVNAGAMDLEGNLFFGGTSIALDTLIDGTIDNDSTDGGYNVCRTFRVGTDNARPYVNAPVSPMALYVGLGTSGLACVDLCGTGFTTNAPGGALENVGFENFFVTSRYLSTSITGNTTSINWSSIGQLANGDHRNAFGITGRYTSGNCSTCTPTSFESEWAVGDPILLGLDTPTPGVNEGSSGYETMVRNSEGSQFLSSNQDIGLVRDILLGNFLDTVYFDKDNPFAATSAHRTYNAPLDGSISNNTIADPPFPNPPPLRFPVGLPHAAVIFDQFDLEKAPFVIEGSEVFARDVPMEFNDGTGIPPFTWLQQSAIQLSPTFNQSNNSGFDVPPLPNGGFLSPFPLEAVNSITTKFAQTGPMPETSTTSAVVLSTLNAGAAGAYDPGGLTAPYYQSRQQIGNFMFVTDGVNKKLHAVNSNTMGVIESLDLPDPYGLGMTSDLRTLYVSNEGDNSLSVVDADPRSATFMTELKRIKVGNGPRAVAVAPDNEDVFVLDRLGNTISIVDAGSSSLRKTISESGINRPNDIALGMREIFGGPGFQSGTFHGYVSNGGGDNMLIYESGPAGVAGLGFDNILGELKPGDPPQIGNPNLLGMEEPQGVCYDPFAPLDTFSHTVGCYVAHNDPISGRAVVSRVTYTKDDSPGQTIFNAFAVAPGFGTKVFEVTQQYVSDFTGKGLDVALPDYRRETFEVSDWRSNSNLLNAGAIIQGAIGAVGQFPRNSKYPISSNIAPAFVNGPRWNPDRVYLLIGGGIIDVFDVATGLLRKTISLDGNPTVLTSYFEQ